MARKLLPKPPMTAYSTRPFRGGSCLGVDVGLGCWAILFLEGTLEDDMCNTNERLRKMRNKSEKMKDGYCQVANVAAVMGLLTGGQ